MKKNLFALIILFFTIDFAFSQVKLEKLSLDYGEVLPDTKQELVKIIGESNGKIFGLATQKDDYYIQIFESKSMSQISSNKIVIPELNDKEVDFEDIFLINGKLYVIGSVYNNKEKIFNLRATRVSEKGVLDPKTVKMFESEVAKKSARGQFYFKEGNGVLLVMHTSMFSKEDAVKYEIKLFNDNMEEVFSHDEKVVFDDHKKDYEFTIADFELDHNNDVFMVIDESYRDNKAKEKIEKFEVHTFKKEADYKKEIVKINLKDKEIINCKMIATGENMLKLVGFYAGVRPNGKANKELRGVYNITMDIPSSATSNIKFNEFTKETRAKIMGERRAEKGKELPPNYSICNLIEKEDGGLIVLSEYQTVVYGKTTGIGPLQMTPITYTKNEIIVTSLNPDGSHAWSNVLPKEQTSTVTMVATNLGALAGGGTFTVGISLRIPLTTMGKGPEYLGAIPMYRNGELDLVFNDNIKNIGVTDIDEIKAMGNVKNSIPTLFIFDSAGKIKRKDPEEAVKNGLILRTGIYSMNSNTEYLIYATRQKQDKLGRMTLAN